MQYLCPFRLESAGYCMYATGFYLATKLLAAAPLRAGHTYSEATYRSAQQVGTEAYVLLMGMTKSTGMHRGAWPHFPEQRVRKTASKCAIYPKVLLQVACNLSAPSYFRLSTSSMLEGMRMGTSDLRTSLWTKMGR
jgi:hypothetical protein